MITREIIIGFSGNPPLNTDSIYERELVRCKDCTFGRPAKDESGSDAVRCFSDVHPLDWFCADGVRKKQFAKGAHCKDEKDKEYRRIVSAFGSRDDMSQMSAQVD